MSTRRGSREGETLVLAVLRNILIALAAVSFLILLAAMPVCAQTWSSAIYSGLTSVESRFENGTYIWTLTNNSSLAGDDDPSFDILVWSLTPFQVQEPLSYTPPEGWRWAGNRWELASSPSRKYYTPDALAPGKSVRFLYTPDPEGKLLNANGPQPQGLSFIAHVAAVAPGSGSEDGNLRWKPTASRYGNTWYDKSGSASYSDPVPEPRGLLGLAAGILGLAFHILHRRGALDGAASPGI